MGKEKIEEKDVRLLRYAVEQAFDGAMRDGALALLNRLVDSASEAANLEEELLNLKRDNRGCNQPTAKKVRCAETGNQFVSLSDAARAVGLRNGNSIRRAIDRGGTAGGYHWEYLDEKKEVSTDDHHQADGRAE